MEYIIILVRIFPSEAYEARDLYSWYVAIYEDYLPWRFALEVGPPSHPSFGTDNSELHVGAPAPES